MVTNVRTVLIHRRHWDRLLLPILCAGVLVAFALALFADFYRFFEVPLLTLVVWALLRWRTPAGGMAAVSIQGSPKVKALLAWLSFIVTWMLLWIAVDWF